MTLREQIAEAAKLARNKTAPSCQPCRVNRVVGPIKIEYDFDYYEHMIREHTAHAQTIAGIRWRFLGDLGAKTILDYGCGLGAFRAFRPAGIEVDSFDINPKLPTTGIRHQRYDLITLWDVIEHMTDDAKLLPILRRCKYAAISIPVCPADIKLESWKHYRPGEHLRYFTVASLTALMDGYGFDLLTHGTPECPPRRDIHNFIFQRRRKIIVRVKYPLGDGIAATRMLEDFRATLPTWQIDMRGPCPQLFSANPPGHNLTALKESAPDVEQISVGPLGVNHSNEAHLHYCESWTNDLSEKLGIKLKHTGWTPKLYLTAAEMARPPDWPKNYWLLSNGYRDYASLKFYPQWQEVVDLMRQRLPAVEIIQVGHSHPSHHHTPLRGTINRIGRGDRDLRIVLREAFHADGILTSLSALYVMAAALDKPCVCPAGGREPFQWIQFPHARFLQTVNMLDCCGWKSCWRQPVRNCANYANGAAKCMSLIRPDEIVREVEKFYAGGRLKTRL